MKSSAPANFVVNYQKDTNPKFDLAPGANTPMDGFVFATNKGPDPAPPSKLVLQCTKEGMAPGTGCPAFPVGAGSPPNAIPLGEWAVVAPGVIWVHVPALPPGPVGFTKFLPPWNQIKFGPGAYTFTLTITPDATFKDANPGNNTATAHLTVNAVRAPAPALKLK